VFWHILRISKNSPDALNEFLIDSTSGHIDCHRRMLHIDPFAQQITGANKDARTFRFIKFVD
jgi:hypothetical protein